MKNPKLSQIWDSLHSSYWFVPTLMAMVAIALALIMLMLDRADKSEQIELLGLIYTGGASGAREVLSSVAGSMISVAGTVFSITIVALQLASANFGPRLLRNFMQDTGNQIVLGTFISTFIYCLLILRTIQGDGDGYDEFIPQISVTFGIVLAIVSIGVLIYFIHHASTLIQVSTVISGVGDDLNDAIERLFPEKIGHSMSQSQQQIGEIPGDFDSEAVPIRANSSGYLQTIDHEELLKIASQQQLLLCLKYRPGKFIIQGSNLVMVWPGERVKQKLTAQLNDAFILGKERTEQQDVEFPINQLVEIALRAISPSINDPFTAIRCIDRLSVGLSYLAQREFPSAYRYDEDHNLRVIAEPVSFAELADAAFNQIRQYSTSDVAVTIRLLEAIAVIAIHTHNQKDRMTLLRHAKMIERNSCEAIGEDLDKQDVQEKYLAAIKALKQ